LPEDAPFIFFIVSTSSPVSGLRLKITAFG